MVIADNTAGALPLVITLWAFIADSDKTKKELFYDI